MVSLPKPAIRLSAPSILAGIVLTIVLVLLIGKRLDAPFAGGEGAGPHHDAQLLYQYTLESDAPHAVLLPSTLSRGEAITTDAQTFATYTLNNTCKISLAENTSLTLQDGREYYNTFTILTGRIVARGDCVFTTHETEVSVAGSATLVHFSWRDELVVKALEGSTVVDQSGTSTTVTPEMGGECFFTLPSASYYEPCDFSLTEDPSLEFFYTWSLFE